MEPEREAFFVNHYRWATAEWQREVFAGFPLVRLVKGSSAVSFLEVSDSLPKVEQLKLGRALAKRFHPEAVRLLNDPVSAAEAALLQRFDAKRMQTGGFHAAGARREGGRVSRKELLRLVNTELGPLFGEPELWGDGRELRFQIAVGRYSLQTYVDCGGRDRQLAYHHSVVASEVSRLAELVSILSWLGIASETQWDTLSAGEEQSAVQGLRRLCEHFWSVLPGLLSEVDKRAGS